jgi:hypothetical protein
MKNKFFLLVFISFLLVSFGVSPVAQAAVPTSWLGKIFLQVEAHGEAWYVNPLDAHRYFLGRPDDAFAVMRAFGLGVSNRDFSSWQGYAPSRLSGRIVLKVEDLGKAYYINPRNLQLLYLGSPSDAFAVMRQVGIGITNANLSLIQVEFNLPIVSPATNGSSATPPAVAPDLSPHYFSWTYKQKTYSLDLNLDANLYQSYASSPKDYSYSGTLPANWRESYYQTFLTPKAGDNAVDILTNQLKALAQNNNLSDDELVELTVAFVQAIPYDYARVSSAVKPNYPYETLYRKLGVCSDKVFLGIMLLRDLGYGAADLDFPDKNHAALGIECASQYAVYEGTYCFAETTNFFPIGFVPQNLDPTGIAVKPTEATIVGQFDHVFETAPLGKTEIYQKTLGKIYGGIVATHQAVERLRALEANLTANKQIIDALKQQIDAKLIQVNTTKQQLQTYQDQGNIAAYNQLVPAYNQLAQEYNELVNNYKIKVATYNSQGVSYNQEVTDLYAAGK